MTKFFERRMKAMGKLKLAIVLILALALTGCSLPLLGRKASTNRNVSEAAAKVEEQEKPAGNGSEQNSSNQNGSNQNGSNQSNIEEKNEPETPVESKQEQPEPQKSNRLDFDILDKLDNTKFSWGLSLNSEHKTPGIPSRAKQLITEYDGIYIGDTTKKVIYLTFDEGYENGYTPKILDTLKENDVKAIFFVTGPYIKKNADLVKRMLDEGHEVGNHTINHPSMPSLGNTELEKEMYGLEERFKSSFGKEFRYLRPPMGEYSERTLAAAQQLGYKTVFWSFAYKDYDVNNQKGADYAYKKVMDNLHNGAVLLLHAVSKDNAEALDRIIKDIRAQDYEIRPFDL